MGGACGSEDKMSSATIKNEAPTPRDAFEPTSSTVGDAGPSKAVSMAELGSELGKDKSSKRYRRSRGGGASGRVGGCWSARGGVVISGLVGGKSPVGHCGTVESHASHNSNNLGGGGRPMVTARRGGPPCRCKVLPLGKSLSRITAALPFHASAENTHQ